MRGGHEVGDWSEQLLNWPIRSETLRVLRPFLVVFSRMDVPYHDFSARYQITSP